MPLPTPNLDDRTFAELVEQAKARVAELCPQWTDLSAGDPGVTLLELFAYLTDAMLYRLNRVPDKAYVEFLRLMGVTLQPPSAARVTLRFSLAERVTRSLVVPQGTRVAAERGSAESEGVVFITSRSLQLDAAHPEADVVAYHCEQIKGELAGTGTGRPGHWVRARRGPIIAPTGEELDLIVAVETEGDRLDERTASLNHEGKTYRIWREVENFAQQTGDRHVYVADRTAGLITFAPAVRRTTEDGLDETAEALAAVPEAGREIRLWYRRGGGVSGNVAPALLTTLKDPVPGVKVTNPAAATGGRTAETLDNALRRGPQELHSLKRAVTARDFELVAERIGGVGRAKALTRAALWQHASPGSVEVLLVPERPETQADDEAVTLGALEVRQTDASAQRVQDAVDERRPLGTTCRVGWAGYKPVGVRARVVVHAEEDPAAVKRRVLTRVHRLLDPLGARPFGQPLRASHVYDAVLAEPGVRYAEGVSLSVSEAPSDAVESLVGDAFEAGMWYAGAGPTLFRSMNDGDGWESVGRFESQTIRAVRASETCPGLVAVATRVDGTESEARLHISEDCGETWRDAVPASLTVHDLAWTERDRVPILLVATTQGLYQLPIQPGDARLVQVLVDAQDQGRGFYAVAVSPRTRGGLDVAVAAQQTRGVYLSVEGGRSGTFQSIGLVKEDVRVLRVQRVGPRAFLWAGLAAAGGVAGKGCHRWELRETADTPERWQPYGNGWRGGSCHGLAFAGSLALAATFQAGVLRMDTEDGRKAEWAATALDAGLPLRDADRLLYRVDAVGARERPSRSATAGETAEVMVMAATPRGIYRSEDGGRRYHDCSGRTFTERVTLPPTWLFCSDVHEIQVVSEDEGN